jgi:hypothetical protein
MKVIIIEHARERMRERGVAEEEVLSVLDAGEPQEAEGRRSKEATFEFLGEWQGRRYPQKKVRVIYIEEAGSTVVITVYAFYGRWETK